MLMIRSSRRLLIGAITVVAGLLGGCASLDEAGRSRLDLVKQRDELLCGVSGKIPGFSFLTPEGTYTGLDVDICRAMAAAFLGDADKVQYRPLTAPERFTALRSGEIDCCPATPPTPSAVMRRVAMALVSLLWCSMTARA
jgi:general L-amino acid transport system substrate-binding protein